MHGQSAIASTEPEKDTAGAGPAQGAGTDAGSTHTGGSLWRVVGGENLGGIVVRVGKEYDSSKAESRLSTGAIVQELEAHGERLCYRLLEGTGPAQGWVSKSLKGKELLLPAAEAVETVEGGRGFGRLLRLEVVRAFEEALELSWRVLLDADGEAAEASSHAPAQEAALEEASSTTRSSMQSDPAGPYPAVVELVLDHAPDKRNPRRPLRPPQDAYVKRVEFSSDSEAMLHNMPCGRPFLISVIVRFHGQGRLRSAWISVATRSVKDRPRRVQNLDPRGEERGRGLGYGCDGFVVGRTKPGQKVVTHVRCLRCGCSYQQHEMASEVPADVNLIDVRTEGRSDLRQMLEEDGGVYSSSDDCELPLQVMPAAAQLPTVDLGAILAPTQPVPIDMKGRKAQAVLSPDDDRLPRFTLIFLHGFNEAAETWEAKEMFRPLVEQGLRVVLPNAPGCLITAYGGRRFPAWYDYLTDHNGTCEDTVDGASLRKTRNQIGSLIDREASLFGRGGHRRVLVGGSSQGCCAAFDAFARHPKVLGGFVGLVGHPLSMTPLSETVQRKVPCFFYNGAEDSYARWAWVEPIIGKLVKAGWTFVRARAAGGVGHAIGEENEQAWLTEFLDPYLAA